MSRVNLEYAYQLKGDIVFPFDTPFVYSVPYSLYNHENIHLVCVLKNETTLEYELDDQFYYLIDHTDLDEDDVIEDMGYFMRDIENKKDFTLEATGEKVKVCRVK